MIHLIGNTASTGSSLLSQILNRHSAVYSGEETHLFTKAELYADWNRYKHRINKKGISGLRSPSWHKYNGVDLQGEWSSNLDDLTDFHSFSSFVSALSGNIHTRYGKTVWVEKTPGNIYSAQRFLDAFSESKMIYLVRQPLENIASMIHRGYDPWRAVARYLVDNALGCSRMPNERILLVRYENLINDPRVIISQICTFLGVDFESEMIESAAPKVKMDGWGNYEDGPITQNNGRFDQLDSNTKTEVMALVQNLNINTKSNLYNEQAPQTISDIAVRLQYDMDLAAEPATEALKNKWKTAILKDKVNRLIRRYPNSFRNYPIIIK